MKYRSMIMLVAGATLMGCTHSAVQQGEIADAEFIRYECESNKAFEVAYLASQEAAILRLPKYDYRLMQIPSASGGKYILDDGRAEGINPITLYTKGDSARLELERVIYKNCQTN